MSRRRKRSGRPAAQPVRKVEPLAPVLPLAPLPPPSGGGVIRVSEARLARDQGLTVAEVEAYVRQGVESGWIQRPAPGVFVLTIPGGVGRE